VAWKWFRLERHRFRVDFLGIEKKCNRPHKKIEGTLDTINTSELGVPIYIRNGGPPV